MDRRIALVLALVSLVLVCPARQHAWQWVDGSLQEVPVPAGAHLVSPETSADFDNDGEAESLVVADGRARLQTGDRIRWQSPPEWQVGQALVADLNRDGRPEAVLLVWRPFRPWPVDAWLPYGGRISDFHDSNGTSCHLILIGWYRGAFRERWAGSALAAPVKSFAVADLSGDGEQLLVTLEAQYDDPAICPGAQFKGVGMERFWLQPRLNPGWSVRPDGDCPVRRRADP